MKKNEYPAYESAIVGIAAPHPSVPQTVNSISASKRAVFSGMAPSAFKRFVQQRSLIKTIIAICFCSLALIFLSSGCSKDSSNPLSPGNNPNPGTTVTVKIILLDSLTQKPISSAVLTANYGSGISATTDSAGIATFNNMPKGLRIFTITSLVYKAKSISQTLTSDTTITCMLQKLSDLPVSVTIIVKDSLSGKPVPAVTVTSTTGVSATTDSAGIASFSNITRGIITFILTSPDIKTKNISLTVISDSTTTCTIQKLSDLLLHVTVLVQDHISKFPIRDIVVKSGANTASTDKQGICTFLLPGGNNTISTQNDFYTDTVTNVILYTDTTIVIPVKLPENSNIFSLRILVYDTETRTPIAGAKITDSGSMVEITNSLGEAFINYLISPMNLTVSMSGYDPVAFKAFRPDSTWSFYLKKTPPPVMGDYWPFHLGDIRKFQLDETFGNSTNGQYSNTSGTETWLLDSVYDDNLYYYYRISDYRKLTIQPKHYDVRTNGWVNDTPTEVNDTTTILIQEDKTTHRLGGFLSGIVYGAPYYRYYPVAYGDIINVSMGNEPRHGRLQLNVGLIDVSDSINSTHYPYSYSFKRIP